jgi:PAS domain S-box-containing protein
MVLINLVVPINPYRYEIYLFPLFAWIGLAFRRGTAIASLPLLVITYLVPLALKGHLSTDSAQALLYVAVFCALQGEGLAWLVALLSRAQAALRESEARFRALSEHASDIVSVVDAQGRFTYVSPSVRPILGYEPSALLGTSYFEILHPDEHALSRERLERGATSQLEARVRHADGSWHWLEYAIRDARDDPLIGGLIATGRDITQRKQVERTLEQASAAAEELARLRQEQARAAEAMSEVSAALGSALDLADLYPLIFQQAGKVLPFDHAQILVPDEDWLMVVAYRGEPRLEKAGGLTRPARWA